MHGKPAIPSGTIAKWQRVVDILADIFEVPAGLVMKAEPPKHVVLVTSGSPGNPYEAGMAFALHTGLYCDAVMDKRAELLVRDAHCEPEWRSNPDLKHGMSFYFGLPLIWPDGSIFGTICVLDGKNNRNADRYRNLLAEFKHVIDSDLALLVVLSEQERLDRELQRSNEELERRVQERTRDLAEANTALRVLLDRVEASKRELEDRIARNIQDLVLPHVETLKRRLRAEDLLLHVGLLESNIVNATSPSAHRMALKFACLTPTEIEIAQLIMRGSSTKQIANSMARATSTIDFHRNNIRKKLGIESRNLNLRSYLSSLH